MARADEGSQRRGGRWLLGLLLVVSVALNAFLLAKMLGSQMHADRGRGAGLMRSFLQDAPELRETARALRQERRAAHRAARRALRDARQEFRAAMVREPFDTAALEAAQAKVHAARAEMGAVRLEARAALIAKMTPEQRAAFAQHMAEREARRAERRARRDREESE
ncbi:MAG: periplasmic heavy metal sensor [Pseudomonadota bacterium]